MSFFLAILKHWRCHRANKLACYISGPYEEDINAQVVYDCWTGSCQPRTSCFVPVSDRHPFVAVHWNNSGSQHYLIQTGVERGEFKEAITAIERDKRKPWCFLLSLAKFTHKVWVSLKIFPGWDNFNFFTSFLPVPRNSSTPSEGPYLIALACYIDISATNMSYYFTQYYQIIVIK